MYISTIILVCPKFNPGQIKTNFRQFYRIFTFSNVAANQEIKTSN